MVAGSRSTSYLLHGQMFLLLLSQIMYPSTKIHSRGYQLYSIIAEGVLISKSVNQVNFSKSGQMISNPYLNSFIVLKIRRHEYRRLPAEATSF